MDVAEQQSLWREEPPQEDDATLAPMFTHQQIQDAAFDYYRATGFPVKHSPVHVCMQSLDKLRAMPLGKLMGSLVGYAEADSYHPHRFKCKTHEALQSPWDAFHDDRILRKAIDLYLNHGIPLTDGYWSGLNFARGTRPPFQFRPAVAAYIYRTMSPSCADGDILDPCSGYGGRLFGWMASGHSGDYVGVDPVAASCDGNLRMARDMTMGSRVHQINKPFEDIDPMDHCERFKLAFTSPPYFNKEEYSYDDTQSFMRYRTVQEWDDGFLRPLMRGVFTMIRPGCPFIVNIADIKIKNKTHVPLVEMTISAGAGAGFEYQGPLGQRLRLPAWGKVKKRTEDFYVFRRT